MSGIYVNEGRIIVSTMHVRGDSSEIEALMGVPEKRWEADYVQVTLTYTNHTDFISWLDKFRQLSSVVSFKALFRYFYDESYLLEGKEAFFFMNDLYNGVPGRTGSAYGLGMLVGGAGGGYLAKVNGLKVEYNPKTHIMFIKSGEFAGRMIGRGGQNVKAIASYLGLVRPTKVVIKD